MKNRIPGEKLSQVVLEFNVNMELSAWCCSSHEPE
jgi:hypothetical protein